MRYLYLTKDNCSHVWDITLDGKYFICDKCNKKLRKNN